MKTTTKNVMALAIFSSALLFSGCQKDLYDPEYAASKNGLITGVPSDFNWSTISSVNLTVNVDDQYNGEFYYIVEVYNNNPLFSSDSKLLAKGVAKKGQAFTSTVTTPQGLSTLYVCQTNPLGFKEVKAVDVSSVNLACNFGSVSTKSSAVSTRSVAYRSTSFTYPTYSSAPSGAIVINDNTSKKYTITTGKDYVIEGSYNGEITFPGEGNVTVYVKGKWTNSASSISLQKNTKIIILDGGEFATSKNLSITGNGNETIEVMPSGKFNTSDNKIDISLNTNGQIINQGIFNIDDLYLPSQASVHNNGTMSMNSLTIQSAENSVINDKTLIAKDMSLTKGTLTNNDVMTITNTITGNGTTIQNNGTLTTDKFYTLGHSVVTNNCKIFVINKLDAKDTQFALGSNSLLQSKNMDADGINVELKGSSIFNISNEANFKGTATFKGIGPDFALVKMEKASIKQWNLVYYKDYVKVETNSHPNNSAYSWGSQIDYYSIEGAASISKVGESGINIAASDCTGEGATTPTDNENPSSPTFPIVVPTNTSYTYAMEDLWPNYGDYDMNDIVVTVSTSSTINSSNKVLSMTINADLRAIGAEKSLGAAFQLDKVAAGSVSGVTYSVNSIDGSVFELSGTKIEAGQTQAIIPLFDNAHDFLGSSGITNTVIGGKTAPSKSVTIVITFNENTVSQDDIDVKNLNFFIVTDKQKTNRTEIHLKGYQATDKANTALFGTGVDNSNGTDKYTSKDNLVWGIMLPTTFNYPIEHISILDAYPDFKVWAISGGTQNINWYDTPNNTSIYK